MLSVGYFSGAQPPQIFQMKPMFNIVLLIHRTIVIAVRLHQNHTSDSIIYLIDQPPG